jgi:phosphoglycolate phosphatase-like HAD superfamily hydrolase
LRSPASAGHKLPMKHRPVAIIFDVEGTLVDCVPKVLASWHETLSDIGHEITVETLQRYSGLDGADMLDRLIPDIGAATRKRILSQQGELYRRKYLLAAHPFEGVRPLFEDLKRGHYLIGIATTCKADELAIYDRDLNILQLCDAVASGSETSSGKPHPDLYRNVLQKLALTDHPAGVMAVGDSPFDAMAARALGLQCVGVATGGFSVRKLKSLGCSLVLQHVRDLRDHLVFPSEGPLAA